MKFLVRAVVTGFGLSLGAALFKKIQAQLGFGDAEKDKSAPSETLNQQDGGTDPGLHHHLS